MDYNRDMSEANLTDQLISLLKERHYLTAPEMVKFLAAQGHRYNKTSVYRALDRLLADGLICRQNLHDNELVFELRTHHHDHLVCSNCGKVEMTTCQVNLPAKVGKNFAVDHHHLTIYGYCHQCQLSAKK